MLSKLFKRRKSEEHFVVVSDCKTPAEQPLFEEQDITKNPENDFHSINLQSNLRGRSIHEKVIPTVCNLKNMIHKLEKVNGDFYQLKQWEKRSYQAYQIGKIKNELLSSSGPDRIGIIRNHILSENPNNLGASCIDIYLVAFVAETIAPGKQAFFEYIKKSGISDNQNSAQAIWQVGKGDGVYLGLLNDDGTIKDWDFFKKWLNDDDKIGY